MCKVGRMSKRLAGLLFVTLGVVTGCGDNARDCGPGTIEKDGSCLPGGGCGFGTHQAPGTLQCVPDETACSDGTVFDPLTGSCKIDPTACQGGTVLIADRCVDPAAGAVVDAEEGPEPNGLGILEPSEAQAGNITLAGAGNGAFVVHGTISPQGSAPDVDTYVITVAGPTFLKITADGVGGTAAGFVALAATDDTDDTLVDWRRVGLSLVSDASQRELLLPRAGTYHLAIADTRTLVDYLAGSPTPSAPGSPTSEYYVSITEEAPPTATALPISNGSANVSGSLAPAALAVYSVPFGTGLNTVRLSMPSALAEGAVVVLRDDELAATGPEGTRLFVGNVDPGELVRIVVEQAYSLSPTPVSYTLATTASSAVDLSTTGATVSATATTSVGTDFARLNLFAFEVSDQDATLGMQLAWSPAIVGEIYDSSGERVASFTSPSSNVTWTQYRGLVRLAEPGRYYFAVYAPSATSSTTLSVTSTITALVPAAITEGTPLTAPVNAFRSMPFTYAAGTDPWQQFNVTGVSTGGQTASWFDPLVAYGRLDSLATSAGVLPPEIPPIFARAFSAAGGAFGRVLLSDGTQRYFVKVNATNPTGSPTVTVAFAPRANATDLGSVTSGSVSLTGQTLAPGAPQKFFVFRTPPGSNVTITVTPTSSVNTQFRRLAADETPLGALINTSAAGADTETFTQSGADWTAFVVSAAASLSGTRTFDVTVSVQ